jgi:hypothetical protein
MVVFMGHVFRLVSDMEKQIELVNAKALKFLLEF